MSKKRTANESVSNEETNAGSDPVIQEENDAKRAKPSSSSDTTLQDLPIEMVEYILVRAVALEVKSMRLSKAVWRKKVDLVIGRLQTVCSQWKIILTSNVFRNELHKYLDDTAHETIHLEILHQLTVQFHVFRVTKMKDEIFLLCRPNGRLSGKDYVINVCEHNGMAVEVKEVIPVPGITNPLGMEACSVSNCLYVLNRDWAASSSSVLRITRDEDHPVNISTLITYRSKRSSPAILTPFTDFFSASSVFTVSGNGSIIIVSKQPYYQDQGVVRIYDANGSIQNKIILSRAISSGRCISNVLQRPSGNLVLIFDGGDLTQLIEIDAAGNKVHEHRSRVTSASNANFADVYGRIFIYNWRNTLRLLDSELNLLDFSGPRLNHKSPVYSTEVHHSKEWNESVRIHTDQKGRAKTMLTIFRFRDNIK